MRRYLLSLALLGCIGAAATVPAKAAPVQPAALAPVVQMDQIEPAQYGGYERRREWRRREEWRRRRAYRRGYGRGYRRY